jgi:hypothetical protein
VYADGHVAVAVSISFSRSSPHTGETVKKEDPCNREALTQERWPGRCAMCPSTLEQRKWSEGSGVTHRTGAGPSHLSFLVFETSSSCGLPRISSIGCQRQLGLVAFKAGREGDLAPHVPIRHADKGKPFNVSKRMNETRDIDTESKLATLTGKRSRRRWVPPRLRYLLAWSPGKEETFKVYVRSYVRNTVKDIDFTF